ncbi:MAG: hypothetical protein ACREJC_16950 [Tepidisphaeraceae bacterium]
MRVNDMLAPGVKCVWLPLATILAIAVVALPSLSAAACSDCCAAKTRGPQDARHTASCCHATSNRADNHDTKLPSEPSDNACGTMCYSLPTTLPTAGCVHVTGVSVSSVVPDLLSLCGRIDHDSIFHPPRA